MDDITVTISHIPQNIGKPENYVGIDLDAPDYQITIFDRELTEKAVFKGIRMILQIEKSRQHGTADSFEEKG